MIYRVTFLDSYSATGNIRHAHNADERDLNLNAVRELFRQSTADNPIMAVTIEHASGMAVQYTRHAGGGS